MSYLVEYTVKVLVRQDQAPDTEEDVFVGKVGDVLVERGYELLFAETTDVEIVEEEA